MPEIPSLPGGGTGTAKKSYDPIPEVDQYRTPTILKVEVEDVKLQDINPAFREKYDIEATHEFNFRFKVLEGDFKNRKVWANAHALWHDGKNCRLRLWAQEIMGVDEFPEGYVFNSDHLVGQNCRITIKNYNKRDGSVGETAADVLRAIPEAGATAAPVPSAAAAPTGQFIPSAGFAPAGEDEEPFLVDAGEWSPADGYGLYPSRMLP